MFIVCGVLYAIDSVTERNTKIRLALDLYHSKLLDVSLTFTNPFRRTTTVGYNPKNKVSFYVSMKFLSLQNGSGLNDNDLFANDK